MVQLQTIGHMQTQVLVAGGGTAGVFAAVAAAKSGAKTLLIEKNSMLGGTMTAANVNFPGLFFAWGKQIIGGPCWEAIERTAALGGAELPHIQFRPAHHWDEQILVNRFVYTAVLRQMLQESGVTVLTDTMLAAAEENGSGVQLLVTAKEGVYTVCADVLIDATGDANAVRLAGYPVEKSVVQQPATLQNHLSGYRIEDADLTMLAEKCAQADLPSYIDAGYLTAWLREHRINMHVPCVDADTSAGKARLEQDAAALLLRIYQLYRSVKGLENLTIDFTAEETGVRETNRIVGENTLTAQAYITGTRFSDAVCYAFYPIDLHVMHGIQQQFFAENTVGQIPYGALIPKDARHILCAGRCIASDTDANSAIRVQAPCMATGQAAGCAAAIAALQHCTVKDVPYDTLCAALKKIHAIVPNNR